MTITRGFGFSINTQTGETTRWAAGDPASVAEHLQPTPCAVCCVGHVTLQHDDAGYYRSCEACGSDYAGAAELALNCKP